MISFDCVYCVRCGRNGSCLEDQTGSGQADIGVTKVDVVVVVCLVGQWSNVCVSLGNRLV